MHGSVQFAEVDQLSAEEESRADGLVRGLSEHKRDWCETDCDARMGLLDDVSDCLAKVAREWVRTSCEAKGIPVGTHTRGEEWLTGPCLVARNLRLLRESIWGISRYGVPRLPRQPRQRDGGQVVAQVFPTGQFDRILFPGFSAEIWMQPDVALSDLPDTLAVAYRNPKPQVCLVLGAGNVSSIGPMDVLYKLFVDNEVALLKMNPVNAYLAPILRRAFMPLIDRGFFQIIEGGTAVASYLCQHECVDSIHITGSDKTHDAIVYGNALASPEEKRAIGPANPRPITSELGNVSPVVVIPGPWTESDIRFQARNVVSMLANNAGFNCNSIRVLITDKNWRQREGFLAAVEEAFKETPTRNAYYPGARQRHEAFTSGRAHVSVLGSPSEHELPWTLIRELDPADAHEMCFTTEPFCSVMGEVSLIADSVVDYLRRAVEFANQRLWGSLCATLLVHPRTLTDAAVRESFDQAVSELRYGTVAVNQWAGIGFGLVSTTWGAHPGHPVHEIQSGAGVVHNTYMFDRPQKTVLRGPFRPLLRPVWFANHRRMHKVGPALFGFERSPSWLRLPKVAMNAVG